MRDVHREILELYGLDASKYEKDGITYFPIYFVMFFNHDLDMPEEDYIF